MSFEKGKIYYGFKLSENKYINEIQSEAMIFVHEKSGAKLLYLKNEDDNKVFSIGFRTPPPDSTGVAHITEHSVLSGSRKYTTKEPFMDMEKGSLKTFMNAITFSDKTIFPIASRNEKDFFNLMDVYLDGVFFPKIYEVEEIFMQEGWHYEIFNEKEPIRYQGVVYNEMLGAYSSPERILIDNINKSLFPDTIYKYSSGGNPDEIPNLTYEDFLNFHRKFYHPSNSFIFIYGNGNIEKILKHIDTEYLSKFNKEKIDSEIKLQKPFNSRVELKEYYPISENESDENRSYFSLNFVIGNSTDPETYLMANIISQILIDSDAAPLKKALLKKGLGQDVFSILLEGLQLGICIVAKNVSEDKKAEFENTVYETLKELVKEGIDKELIKACINVVEFNLREASGFSTKGIAYNLLALDSWLYDKDPLAHIQYESTLNNLKSKVNTDFFEKFIETHIINNLHSSFVTISPKKGLGEEKRSKIAERLKNFKDNLSKEELNNLIEKNIRLKKLQSSDDTEEAKATIPKLDLSDVETKAEIIPEEVIKNDKFTLLNHNIFTSKISYLDFYFDTSMVEEELIPYITLLAKILGKINTKNKTYFDLSNHIYVNTGGINFASNVFVDKERDDLYYPKLIVKGKSLRDNIPKLIEIIYEIIAESKLDDKNRIKEIIAQVKSRMEMSIFSDGHSVAMRRVSSYFSPSSKYKEKLQGLDFYWFLNDILKNFNEKSDEVLYNLNKVYNKIFNVNNLIISFTGDKDDFNIIKNNLHIITDNIDANPYKSNSYNFEENKLNEGIMSSANVQYVSKGYNLKKLGYDYSGSLLVLSTLLSREYLHNKIRAQGGAYGAGISIDRTGNIITYSYRDPNLKYTIDVYNNMADFIDSLNISQSELINFIIGTISRIDSATTPHMKGQISTIRFISNITYDDIQKNRDEILNTNLSDIKECSLIIKDAMDKNYICVLGNENIIKQDEKLFTNLVKLNN